jgi:dsRNA-specific ribonuclease
MDDSENSSLQHFDLNIDETQVGQYDVALFQHIEKAIGHAPTTNLKLYRQAFCHSSNLDAEFKSNEILEWIGDAVLTVAIRSWLYDKFASYTPGQLTLLESTVVSNRTLAIMATRLGLHRFIAHQDKTLPQRIDEFAQCLDDKVTNMSWTVNPPKAVADIVEALLGVVYLDAGLEKCIAASQYCLAPILNFISTVPESSLAIFRLPKQRLMELGGDVFKLQWKTNAGKKGVEVSVGGETLLFLQDDDVTVAESKASALILKAIERKKLSLERFRKKKSSHKAC